MQILKPYSLSIVSTFFVLVFLQMTCSRFDFKSLEDVRFESLEYLKGAGEASLKSLKEPSGIATSFQVDGLSESVDEYNGLLFLNLPVGGVSLRYSSNIFGGREGGVRARSGFGVGWKVSLGRYIEKEFDVLSKSEDPYDLFSEVESFENGNGSRFEWICEIRKDGIVDTPDCKENGYLKDRSKIEKKFNSYEVVTTYGVTHTLNHEIGVEFNDETTPRRGFGGGAEGFYVTRIEDLFGNYTKVEYYGQKFSKDKHSPIPRIVRTGRKINGKDQDVSVVYFFLAGEKCEGEPKDLEVNADSRIEGIRYPGSNSSEITTHGADKTWQGIDLTYDANGEFLVGVTPVKSSSRFEFGYIQKESNFEGRLNEVKYPSGGKTTYSYEVKEMVRISENFQYTGPHIGVAKRVLEEPQTGKVAEWKFASSEGCYGYNRDLQEIDDENGECGKSENAHADERNKTQKTVVTVKGNLGDDGARVETWFEPMYGVKLKEKGKTGLMRHRRVFAFNNAMGKSLLEHEEHAYTAFFKRGFSKASSINPKSGGDSISGLVYEGYPGAKGVRVWKKNPEKTMWYLEEFRDPERVSQTELETMSINGGKDYDVNGHCPYVETSWGENLKVEFEYWSFDRIQDRVTVSGKEEKKNLFQKNFYLVDTDVGRKSLYEAKRLIHLKSGDETRDKNQKLLAKSLVEFDTQSDLQGEVFGLANKTQTIYVDENGQEQLDKSPEVSRVYALEGSFNVPGGALMEEKIKVSSLVSRVTRLEYDQGDSCTLPSQPTKKFVNGTWIEETSYNCLGQVNWVRNSETGEKHETKYDDRGRIEQQYAYVKGVSKLVSRMSYEDAVRDPFSPARVTVTKVGLDPLKPDEEMYSSSSFFDGIGRTFHIQTEKEVGDGEIQVVAVSKKFFRDTQADVEITRPYLSAGEVSSFFSEPSFSGAKVITDRDGFGRVLFVQQKRGDVYIKNLFSVEYGDDPFNSSLELNQVKEKDADQRETITEIDELGRVKKIIYPDKDTTVQNQYDVLGRLVQVNRPDGRMNKIKHDGLGRVIETTVPESGTNKVLKYDLTGAVLQTQSASQEERGEYTEFSYDSRGRIELEEVVTSKGARSPKAKYEYDAEAYSEFSYLLPPNPFYSEGKLVRVRFGKNLEDMEEYAYDSLGRMTEIAKNYLGLGIKKSRVEMNIHGDVLRSVYQEGNSTEMLDLGFEYDKGGRQKKIFNRGQISRCGDPFRVLMKLEYDLDGSVQNEQWLPCGENVLQKVDFERDEFGRLMKINDPDQIKEALDSGGGGETLRVSSLDSGDVFGMRIGYEEKSPFGFSQERKNGSISWIQWHTQGFSNRGYVYTYDPKDQITNADYWEKPSKGSWTSTPKFDLLAVYRGNDEGKDFSGNLKTLTRNNAEGQSQSIEYSTFESETGRLRKITEKNAKGETIHSNFTYDLSGNVETNSRWGKLKGSKVTYDHRNLATEIFLPGETLLKFQYDHSGNRYKKEVHKYSEEEGNFPEKGPNKKFYFLPQAVYSKDENKFVQLWYWNIPGVGKLVPRNSSFGKEGLSFNFEDQVGSVRVTLHEDGTIDEATDYDPFGKEIWNFQAQNQQKGLEKFTGQRRDKELTDSQGKNLDLDYFVARYYDPELGRFLSVDPMASKYPHSSGYVYALNNPIRFNDPSGMESEEENKIKFSLENPSFEVQHTTVSASATATVNSLGESNALTQSTPVESSGEENTGDPIKTVGQAVSFNNKVVSVVKKTLAVFKPVAEVSPTAARVIKPIETFVEKAKPVTTGLYVLGIGFKAYNASQLPTQAQQTAGFLDIGLGMVFKMGSLPNPGIILDNTKFFEDPHGYALKKDPEGKFDYVSFTPFHDPLVFTYVEGFQPNYLKLKPVKINGRSVPSPSDPVLSTW